MGQKNSKSEDIRKALSDVRKDLLDFGLRNPLLNFRPLKSRGITVASMTPADVFRILIQDGRELSFAADEPPLLPMSSAGSADEGGECTSLAIPQGRKSIGRLEALPTVHSAAELDQRLLATYYSAKSSLDEQGVNTLYFALGFLSWSDPADPREFHRAPLILIPIELERKNASEGFTAKYNGDDILPNICLLEFMKQSLGIEIESYGESDDLDVNDYYNRVTHAIRRQAGWTVDPISINLGFFSFAKFLMYRDLDPGTWDDEDALIQHDVLNRLLGAQLFGGEASPFGDGDFVDDHLKQTPIQTVLDADSTQTLALLDAAAGTSMVIQGPPGTGKSQTIVNLIAHAMAAGKRVLFVSEKRAALDVVKQRLDRVGLGDACLELHSNKVKKKSVVEELKRTAGLGSSRASNGNNVHSSLDEAKSKLDEYCRVVNGRVGNADDKIRDLYGILIPVMERLRDVSLPVINLNGCEQWSADDVNRKRASVQRLQDAMSKCPSLPSQHPFWGTQLRVAIPQNIDAVRRTAARAGVLSEQLGQATVKLASILREDISNNPTELERCIETVEQVLRAPELGSIDIQGPAWKLQGREIKRVIEAGKQLSALLPQWSAILTPAAWNCDVGELEVAVSHLQKKWWRLLSPRWRQAKAQMKTLMAAPQSVGGAQMEAIPKAIRNAAELREQLRSNEPLLSNLFGRFWKREMSDWAALEQKREWLARSYEGIDAGQYLPWCLHSAVLEVNRAALQGAVADCRRLLAERGHLLGQLSEILKLNRDLNPSLSSGFSDRSFPEATKAWNGISAGAPELEKLIAYLQAYDDCETANLVEYAILSENWPDASRHLTDLFDYERTSTLITQAFTENPALARFDGTLHSGWVEMFRREDLRDQDNRRNAIAQRHSSSIPRSTSANGQLGILLREFEKKARHLAVRQLMQKAGNAIQAMKPVFMMSPLSVANFLPPKTVEFDLVVFDEASQVKPADSLGAIVRGKQAIVVGDSKQLPPTSFFDSMVASDDLAEENDETATSDIESVLGLFCSRGAHQRMLRWHYRSKHETLIAGSNHLFYDDKLVVFPSPDRERSCVGLVYRRVTDGAYDRSKTRTNRGEARAIVTAVMIHAKEQIEVPREQRLTLGVAALSKAQMDAILDELELQRRRNPAYEEFFSDTNEPFFVKNLETVQGDERDVIFISIGYGRTAEGYLSMSFGPVNRAGGERRLNVLFSRARRRCEVFTSLSSGDIDTTRNESGGVSALKTFLHYAEHGELDIPVYTGGAPQSPFEEQVLRAVQLLGYTAHTQVGSAGFYLDLAIVDPRHPGRYVLGVECDGAAYHSARSSRDRDRLRQAVLVGMGWRIHRIWSTSWFRDPEREVNALKFAIESAIDATDSPVEVQPPNRLQQNSPQLEDNIPPASEHSAEEESEHLGTRAVIKYKVASPTIQLGGAELHLIPAKQLSLWLSEIVEIEGPIHWLEAAKRAANAAGVQRVGNRIQDAFRTACRIGIRNDLFRQDGDFLYRAHAPEIPVRDRTDLPAQSRKLEYIAREEIHAAIELAVNESFGLDEANIAVPTCRLLGFARVTDEMRAIVEDERDHLIKAGRLIHRGETLVCSNWPGGN